MKAFKKWFVCFLALVVALPVVAADDFEQFRESQTSGFDSDKAAFDEYQKELEKEFGQYRKVMQEEFEAYKKRIGAVWEDPKVSSAKTWVEYSSDYRIRKVVDFEQGTVTIEVVEKDGTQGMGSKIAKIASDLITEDTKKAFERDELSQKVEKRLEGELKTLKTDEVEKKPILAPVFTGKDTPKTADVVNAVKDMVKRGDLTKTPAKQGGMQVYALKTTFPTGALETKAKEYLTDVRRYASDRKVDPGLVLAVMHTESAFNPLAKSYVPAYGLMQIVPGSAGKDATQFVFGKAQLLAPSYLYNGVNNINMGTAYIHILYYNYLGKIKDPESRLYCAIAAYNTGAGNVARAFIGNTSIKKAADTINLMTPKGVYDTLLKKLPHEETRNYLKNVSGRMALYSNM